MIAVVHLVWGPLGVAPLRRFLDSYSRYEAGVEHELIVIFNGVQPDRAPELLAQLEDVPHQLLTLEQPVQDLGAYVRAGELLKHDRLCFLNSYSEILTAGWLDKLDQALEQPGAGMVGATGSWASLRSAVLNAFLLPNPYRGVVPKRSVAREQMNQIAAQIEMERDGETAIDAVTEPTGAPTLAFRVSSTLKSLGPMPEQLLRFEGFPAHHLRTNAFMIDRARFNALEVRAIDRKMDAYLMESGRRSFTRQIQARGLRTLVVASDGTAFDHDEWDKSRTLWQRDQEGLMVADNQTRTYSHGGLQRRQMLSAFAWGAAADPSIPGVS